MEGESLTFIFVILIKKRARYDNCCFLQKWFRASNNDIYIFCIFIDNKCFVISSFK